MKKIIYFTITVFLVYSIISPVKSIYSLWQKKDILKNERLKLAFLEKENSHIKENLKKSDSNYFVEKIAYDKLFMTKRGESIILLKIDNAPNGNNKKKFYSNWQKWIGLFY